MSSFSRQLVSHLRNASLTLFSRLGSGPFSGRGKRESRNRTNFGNFLSSSRFTHVSRVVPRTTYSRWKFGYHHKISTSTDGGFYKVCDDSIFPFFSTKIPSFFSFYNQ